MSKSIDTNTEFVHNAKHAFRKAEDRSIKAHRRRYERRKIKACLRVGDWSQDQ